MTGGYISPQHREWLDDLDARGERRGEEIDPRVDHQDDLDARDRAYEQGGEPWRLVARQPHDRERREHRTRMTPQDVQLALYPDRPVDSQVTPLGRKAA